jgi:uncharacterized protein YpuA (DUF1002 family)
VPTAAETLSVYARKAKRTVQDAMAEVLDSIEQSSKKSRSEPADELQKKVDDAWDNLMKMRRAGAPDDDIEAAQERFLELRDMSGQAGMKKFKNSLFGER